MTEEKASRIIQSGLENGADFVEIFQEETRHSSMLLRSQEIESSTAATDFGIGIRLLFGTDVYYAHTSNEDPEHLLQFVSLLAQTRENRTSHALDSISFSRGKYTSGSSAQLIDPRKTEQKKKLPFLYEADKIARSVSESIAQVSVSMTDEVSHILVCNSEGLWVEDTRIRSRFSLGAVAEKDGERFSASESPGALRGFEFFDTLDLNQLARETAERAVRMLEANYIEGKKMPVVLGHGFGGVIFHEACGHPLETEAIRRNSSPFVGKLGEKIAHSSVTAIDDGTIDNAWGSISVDDEGMPTQKTVLIENGILKSYLSDRIGAEEVGVPRTGSARRESYQYAPVSRMRNTYIAAGKDKREEMISSIQSGLFAKKMGGGSVNPATGEFNFSVEEGYRIRDGKIAEPVRGATLIGRGHEILPKISMVGDDLELAAGMCGASSGSVPVTVGQPSLKVDEILVGGR